MRFSDIGTYLDDIGDFWLKFNPSLTVTIKKIQQTSPLDYSGGIRIHLSPYVGHIDLASSDSVWEPPHDGYISTQLIQYTPPHIFDPLIDPPYALESDGRVIGLMIWSAFILLKLSIIVKYYLKYREIEKRLHLADKERMALKKALKEEHDEWIREIERGEEEYRRQMRKLY